MPVSKPAAPFQPPSSEGKCDIPEWEIPPATQLDHDFAELHTLDLSLLDSDDPKVVDDLVQMVKTAIKEDGFLYVKNYGVSIEQLHRQFAIAQYNHRNISEEEQERLLWHPETGVYSGYKRPYGWKREKQALDGIKHFNFYKPEFDEIDRIPECIHPFFDEITAFCNYMSKSVNRRLLTILSRVLELDDEFIWRTAQSKQGPTGEGYFRHALFQPLASETKELSKGLRMHGHCDFGMLTLLFSVPVSSLQIWGADERWRYVKYEPGALVVNLGETLEILSGGHFKATRHRVFEPPEDQRAFERLSLVIFQSSIGDLMMQPAMESPLIQREGFVNYQGCFKEYKRFRDAGMPVPSNRQWREGQIKDGREVTDVVNNQVGKDRVEINGKLFSKREFFGMTVLLPV
ncbi:uncharacterized protein IL334_007962 [Kwoniella shivajii]|uniref:Fe2OG dioxygenase domain-containing protein n=1 Tax=Kwoniella shivajii TaxID=564305 RepID=A0ABZ1DAZ9_9TREE|nr:hypothetical protein IL334_007962 [Kwoniella shivajii]